MAAQYPPSTVDRICELLEDGASLSEICREEGMPNRATVWRWGKADDEIGQRIRDAWEIGYIVEGERKYREVQECEDPKRARVLLQAAMWHLGRRSKAYADKPLVQGAIVNVSDNDAFATFARALEGARAERASLADGTSQVASDGETGTTDAAG